jgi:hypothetical protein
MLLAVLLRALVPLGREKFAGDPDCPFLYGSWLP